MSYNITWNGLIRLDSKIGFSVIAEALQISHSDAEAIGALVREYGTERLDSYQSVKDLVRQCYNEPSLDYKLMTAFNEILNGYGVEGLASQEFDYECGELNPNFEYVNMGDTYAPTIILGDSEDPEFDGYFITSYGDFIETFQKAQPRFEVINLDVWGNEEDGFEVNDAHKTGLIVCIPEGSDDRHVGRELVRVGFLKEGAEDKIEDDGTFCEDILFIQEKENGKPFCQLHKVKS